MSFAAVPSLILVLLVHATPVPPPIASSPSCASASENDLVQYVGRYGMGGPAGESVMVLAVRDGALTLRPLLWSGLAELERVGVDSFTAVQYRRPGALFRRDAQGCVVGLDLLGVNPSGYHVRLRDGERRPIEDLVGGRPRDAARAFHRLDSATARLIGLAEQVARMPSRAGHAADFLLELARLRPGSAPLRATLGDVLVAARRRGQAVAAYRTALSLDSANATAREGLARMGIARLPASDSGWTLPFSLERLFAAPTRAEVQDVRASWARRDLAPREVEVIAKHQISLQGIPAEARVVAHRVHGSRHIGVIIVPERASGGLRPILVEAKGVSPSFPPLNVPESLTSPWVLREDRANVIYVVPGYRGEWVKVGADSVRAEGDRSDAWDGATDDLLALLAVARQITPEADTSRVCVFGRSRGGAVALLAGARDPSIGCVVSWAAPTEWLQLMGTAGWTQQEHVADGLRRRSVPGEIGGQFIDYFLDGAIERREKLEDARRHIIASSPLHFAGSLPLTQAHWALDDSSVPIANGRAFVERAAASLAPRCFDARLHPEAGHDQDRQRAPKQSREFLMRAFAMGDSALRACRTTAAHARPAGGGAR